MKRFSIFVLSAALALAAVPFAAHAAEEAMPSVGQVAPTFILPSQTGKRISLKHYRGHWVVLYFYPRDMTSGCTIEAHDFQDNLSQFTDKNAVILGVSVDSTASHQQFCAKDSLTFHLLSDTTHKVVSAYGSLGDYKGTAMAIRNTFLIDPEGKITQVWTHVDPRQSAQEVLTAIPAPKGNFTPPAQTAR
ncbi:MAG TPA: peroxiredoxin [Terracidiphilus sp.]|nr:peroxiredoxin [Terracidiphilus sp.]